jgi:hypothetical protein
MVGTDVKILNRRERVPGVAVPPGKLAVGAENAEKFAQKA